MHVIHQKSDLLAPIQKKKKKTENVTETFHKLKQLQKEIFQNKGENSQNVGIFELFQIHFKISPCYVLLKYYVKYDFIRMKLPGSNCHCQLTPYCTYGGSWDLSMLALLKLLFTKFTGFQIYWQKLEIRRLDE